MKLAEWKAVKQQERVNEAIAYFGSVGGLAEFMSLPYSTVRAWRDRGRLSRNAAKMLEEKTKGRFSVGYMIPTADEWYRSQEEKND